MKKKQLPIFVLIVFILGSVIGFLLFRTLTKFDQQNTTKDSARESVPSLTEEVVYYRATFAIYTNNVFRVFTASMYHNRSADVFIDASDPNIVTIRKKGVTWDDFFKTLPFSLNDECLTTGTKETFCTNANASLDFYLNGVKTPDALDKKIQPEDKLLVTYAATSEAILQTQREKVEKIASGI